MAKHSTWRFNKAFIVPVTGVKTFSAVSSHMTNIRGKFHSYHSTKNTDNASREICVNGQRTNDQLDGRPKNIMPCPCIVGGGITTAVQQHHSAPVDTRGAQRAVTLLRVKSRWRSATFDTRRAGADHGFLIACRLVINSGRILLLFARPTITFPAAGHQRH